MIALVRKELEELAGVFALAVFSIAFVGWAHTTIPLAIFGGDDLVVYLIEDVTIIGCLAAFAAGHSRFGPEFQQGTIAFLDALPTSRHRVFLVKCAVGVLPSLITALGIGVVKFLALTAHPLPNSTSTWPIVAVIVLTTGVLMTAHYATGLVLSWFGEVGWQALLVTGLSMIMVTGLLPSLAQWYPLFSGVLNLEITAAGPVFPLAPLVLWFAWTLAGIFLAWVLFLGLGDRIAYGPWCVKGLAQMLVYTPPVLVILIAVFLAILGSAVQLPSLVQPTFRASTPHFRVLATEANRGAGERLVAEAESVRERVVERFGAEGPHRLDVELTGASEHLGGVFIPGKIQLRTDADAQTLAHELSHAWSHELGAPADAEAWRFFEEGLATFNESVVAEPAAQAAIPYFGTGASDWFLAPSHTRRSRRFNPDDDYSVGRLWAEAIVDVGGDKAPTCVIRAAGARPRDGSDPIPWWFQLLADCDLDMSAVIARYEERLPRDGGEVEMVGWYAGSDTWSHWIETTPAPAGATTVCMARSTGRDPRTQYVFDFVSDGSVCALGKARLRSDHFQVAVGYRDGEAVRVGPWRLIRVP